MASGPKFDELSGGCRTGWSLVGAVLLAGMASGLSACGPVASGDEEWATVTGQVVSTDCPRHQMVVFSYNYQGRRFTNSAASPMPCESLRIGAQLPVQLLKLSPKRSRLVHSARHAS